jgi:hypothetical protein
MIEIVLRTEAFYFSHTYDITHTFQRLQTSSPDFHSTPFIERADQRFVWNRYLLTQLSNNRMTARFALPLIHGCKNRNIQINIFSFVLKLLHFIHLI